VYYYNAAHHNAAATLNRNNQELSASAPEFIPNFKPTPPSISGDWNFQAHHQDTSQIYQPPPPSHIYPPQNHSRPFQQQQQQPQQYQQSRNFQQAYQQQSNRNYRPDLIQNNHHQNYSNLSHQQQQQQHYMMPLNYQQGQGLGGGGVGGGGGNTQGEGIRGGSGLQNRLNFQNSHQPEPVIPHETVPHKQVIWQFYYFSIYYKFITKINFLQTETEQVALDYLSEMVAKLNDNPGMFETNQKKMREMFLELANNHFVMSNAIETIFEQVGNGSFIKIFSS
jgi:hypothetical protein